jgi:hypothetical protein
VTTIDNNGTIALERDRALMVRQKMIELLRAFEDMYNLPRAIPTQRELAGMNGNSERFKGGVRREGDYDGLISKVEK